MLEREIGQGITFENKKVEEESAKILSTHFEQEALERDLGNEDLKKKLDSGKRVPFASYRKAY